MNNIVKATCILLSLLACLTAPALAEVESKVTQSVTLPAKTLDVAVAENGAKVFVLLPGGEVQILSAQGALLEQLKVAGDAERLSVNPQGDRIFVTRAGQAELQMVDLAYVQELPVINSPIKGPENAPVTMTVFSDYQCPYCARLEPVLDQVMAKNPKDVRMVFKQFPLGMHKFAKPAALASLAAREQGKFWPMHDKLFANFNKLNDAMIMQLAGEVGLDLVRLEQDMKNPALVQEVTRDLQLGQKAGVRGTPTVFINGKLVQQRSPAGFQAMIDKELQAAKK